MRRGIWCQPITYDAYALPDGTQGVWIVRNSWGASWGMGGYCVFPYPYFTDPKMASDFWIAISLRPTVHDRRLHEDQFHAAEEGKVEEGHQ